MKTIYSTKQGTIDNLEKAGYYFETYSPGDGVTRYRFFKIVNGKKPDDYFGPGNGIHTCLGWKEAQQYAQGLIDSTRS